MTDAGFFRGTSADQDNRFSDKEKKLLKQMKFEESLLVKIDTKKVKLDVLKPWITERIAKILGMEDDVLVEFIFNQLDTKDPDPRKMQINLTGFVNGKNARLFMGELWALLASAQATESGIPQELIDKKKEEMKNRDDSVRSNLKRLAEGSDTYTRRQVSSRSPSPRETRDRSPRDRSPRGDRDRSSRDRGRGGRQRSRSRDRRQRSPRDRRSKDRSRDRRSRSKDNKDKKQSPPPADEDIKEENLTEDKKTNNNYCGRQKANRNCSLGQSRARKRCGNGS